ncbi:SirB2 family protein [Oleiphilus sp. HI0125]|uniref:SirB2 family protein n=1 Tax=Oleiphilus sp. HI0125 TaxID=1822266 RepID=UPI000837B93C|nr:SirB2 family protein [Oleiphilus sp. HI0125]
MSAVLFKQPRFHVSCAYLTGLGFLLRGILSLKQSALLEHKLTRILPHLIDTFLLLSGLIMMVTWAFWPSEQPWLAAKIIALLLYIGFGLMTLRWGNTTRNRLVGLLAGLSCYVFIIGAAHSKSAWSVFSFM